MSEDALNVAPAAPQTDVLQEQHDAPRPLEAKPQVEEPKADPEKLSRQDVVKQAIDKATKEPEKPKAEAKEPRKEAKPEPKADRAPDGKFAAKQAEPEPQEQPKRPTAYKEPPQRFDDAAKAEWEAVPESVRGTVHRMVKETEQGIQKYRADAEAYEPIRQYDERAKANGGSLADAVQKMVEIEDAFSRNPIEGFHRVGQALGLNIQQVAMQIAQQTPQQVTDHATRMRMADMQRQNEAMQRQMADMQRQNEQALKTQEATSEWAQFQADNPRAKELEAEMASFLTKYPAGPNVSVRDRLADAYAFAVAKTPNAAHTGEYPNAAAQTQASRTPNPAGQKSITGSRSDDQKSKQKLSRSEAILKAMRTHGAT